MQPRGTQVMEVLISFGVLGDIPVYLLLLQGRRSSVCFTKTISAEMPVLFFLYSNKGQGPPLTTSLQSVRSVVYLAVEKPLSLLGGKKGKFLQRIYALLIHDC